MDVIGSQTMMVSPSQRFNQEFQIGTHDEGFLDMADAVKLKFNQSFENKAQAMNFARQHTGAEVVVERRTANGTLSYDLYDVRIAGGKKLDTLADAQHITLFDAPWNVVEQKTLTKGSIKGYLVAANGEISEPVYKHHFARTFYDKLRETAGLDTNKYWGDFVDYQMGKPSPEDNLPPINNAEIQDMKQYLTPGDIIMNGNNGSFVHGILYVDKDPELQAKLEKQWQLPAGALANETLILHSLAVDEDKEVDGKVYKAGGTGPIIDTLEQYLKRHPRDVMVAVKMKDVTESARRQAIESGKKLLGRPYDRGFNTFDDQAIYCTEFVMKAWNNTAHPPEFKMSQFALFPTPGIVTKILPDRWGKALAEDGFLHQEMIMTDGILASPSVEIVWANQNADRSALLDKYRRWTDGLNGKINANYREMLQETNPEIATQSQAIVEKIEVLAARSRTPSS